jgi:cytochrome c-type biogenesis protein CcmF
MDQIVYSGEWYWAATLGRVLVALGFAAALLGFFGYLKGSLGNGDKGWMRIGRMAFLTHAFSFLAVIVLIYVLILNHRYEFQYVWKHLNNTMPLSFQVSSFWGGQEGGFLLWMFWHIVLALVLVRASGRWEGPVLTVITAVQAFLASMLLGIYFGDYQFGLDPFLLMRESTTNITLPWTRNPDYLSLPQFTDGQGLNPLLQNYWMVIHPPTLFLGFASTLVPFAFAVAGLWKKDYIEWMRPATPWSFFSIMILGTGILMGGAWAYEALSFGGFWAWDPVENSSLVPWIMLVGGAHLLMVNRVRMTSLFTTFLLIMGTFIMVVYSTFLTKSGILGDTSVHSFVDSGILPQLLVYLLTFAALGALMLIGNTKERWMFTGLFLAMFFIGVIAAPLEMIILFCVVVLWLMIRGYRTYIPKQTKEEALWSREFWMFIGSLVLLVSAIQITAQTSIAVFNKLLEPFSGMFASLHTSTNMEFFKALSEHSFAPSKDIDQAYHLWQIPLAFIFITLIATTQYLKYKDTNFKAFIAKISRSFLAAAVLLVLLLLSFDFAAHEFPRVALLFATLFAVTANADYLIQMAKGKWDKSGASIAHIGFALLIFGAVISTSQKDVISRNQIGDIRALNEELNNREDMLLMQGDTLPMGDYFVTYRDRYTEGIHVKFEVDYYQKMPKAYAEGDVVFFNNMFFECKEAHTAGRNFSEHMDTHWLFIPIPNERHAREAQLWVSGNPGPFMFTLEPRIQLNEQMGNAPEPDTRHYWNRDLYTHLKWARLTPPETDEDGYLGGRAHDVHIGDSILVSNILVSVDSLSAVANEDKASYSLLDSDIAIRVHMTLRERGITKPIEPLWIVRDSLIVPDMNEVADWGLKFLVNRFEPTTQTINLTIWEHESIRRDFIVMQAVIFPQINILWLGCIIMIIGTTLSIRHRYKLAQKAKKDAA